MSNIAARPKAVESAKTNSDLVKRLIRNRYMYMMVVPGLVYFLIFKYLPMYGLIISFQDYMPYKGITGSDWVGLKHFEKLFTDSEFWNIFRNTLVLFLYNIVFYFPVPIILAVMLNEVASEFFKRLVQTIVYVPHFLSWVIIVSISYVMLTMDGGIINELLVYFGLSKVNFLLDSAWFHPMYIAQVVWREAGWGTIVYLAAIASIDPQLYEAARMDGAGRFRQIWHITLPSIRSVIVVLLILRIGNVLDLSFEHVYLLLNSMNRPIAEILDTYVYTVGLKQGQFSFSTAVGFFKSFVGLFLVIMSNKLAKKFGEEGIY
ncbi:putative multiple-sugar transport system permease YteP [Paenibacillus konkukensis]|uniref:Multiple-sugar transport system permease YteP n=1 Tax=Paenibacillus konkukensis TaxID=2020716 RepID=A0ABY4RNW2_9BACL|nr:sugar ABC transporter permease [Paenibacillus konkukensis]UQZ83732.1 putative multiple-sugar transport system permease YteP [Paenibacillus konkukensis]